MMKSVLMRPKSQTIAIRVLPFLLVMSGVVSGGYEWKIESSAQEGKVVKAVSGPDAELGVNPKWGSDGVLEFGGKQWLGLPEADARSFGTGEFTMVVRARIDKPQTWGALISFSQDNGNYERGWLLGYSGRRFCFKYSTGGKLNVLTSSRDLPLGDWVNLVVVRKGKHITLYQNGVQVAATTSAGKIVLPDIATPFVLGAYKDKDEFFGLHGAMQYVRMSPRSVGLAEVRKKYGAGPQIKFAVRPHVKFVSNDQAMVSWHSEVKGVATIAYGTAKNRLDQFARSKEATMRHGILLTDLDPGQKYFYRIGMNIGGKMVMGRVHELDTALNYLPPVVAASFPKGVDEVFLKQVLSHAGKHPAGYLYVLGIKDGDMAIALAKATQLTVMAFDPDKERVEMLREKAYATGVYGRRITAMQMTADKLPLTSCVANLIVSERAMAGEILPWKPAEVFRHLRPNGGVLVLPDRDVVRRWSGGLKKKDGLYVYERPKLVGSKDWTHQYGTAANSTYTGEEMGGAQAVTDLRLQWLGRPGADFNIDRQPRVSAPLAVNGRLFHQGMNRVIALDAYNGGVLWSMEVPDFRRLNVPHDSANWCADEEHLYMVVEENAWVVDAVTGDVKEYLQIPTAMRESHHWGVILNEGGYLLGSSVKAGAQFKEFWGSVNWFDKVGHERATTQVCSDKVFAYEKGSWKGKWAYGEGVIINSTITVRDGQVFFLENRDRKWAEHGSGRISDRSLWLDLWVVCLDLESGKKKWDEKLPSFKYLSEKKGFIQSAYGLASPHGYLTVFSESVLQDGQFKGQGHFAYHLFDAKSGRVKWSQSSPWRHNHHGAHISHPVIMGDVVFTDPHSLSMKDGKVLPGRLAHRKKCPTPVAWKNGLLFRGNAPGSGSLTVVMWNEEKQSLTGWNRLRPNCWLNYLPTQGGLLIPEGGGGCSCGGWMETSVGFLPKKLTEGDSKP